MNTKLSCTICGHSHNFLYATLKDAKIYECKLCKNAFTFPCPKRIEYEEEDFHGQFNHKRVEDLSSQWKNSIFKQVDLIKKYIKKDGKILEIGCSQGLLLEYLKRKGFEVHGIEPSKSAASIAVERGLNVINGYYPDVSFSNIDFDLIIMSHVLEHIENPLNYLKLLSTNFKGKLLLLIQTNYKGIVPLKLKSSWYAWVPEQHYSHFTESGLKQICNLINVKFIEAEYSTLEHNGYWLSRLSTLLPKQGDQFHTIIQL